MNNDHVIKNTPRDVFAHLLSTIALYWTSANAIVLLFQYVNILYPDPLNPYFDPGGTIRWALAAIIVSFPVLFFISRYIQKDLLAHPEKHDLPVRKWLIYLTLFLSALLILGDLIALLYGFLQGELTMQFFLKTLAVGAVGGSVLWYYLYDLRRTPGAFAARTKYSVWGIALAALVIIGSGFYLVGSPFKQRMIRADGEKLNHLQMIQNETVTYWQRTDRLPERLSELENDITGFRVPKDPETGAAYEYRKLEDLRFELCGTFNLDSEESQIGRQYLPETYGVMGNWEHRAGRHCFDRTINPEIFRYNPAVPEKPIMAP